jgi:hypothetical protein
MNEERARRKLSGILSADAVGYSHLMQEDEVSTIRILEASTDRSSFEADESLPSQEAASSIDD